MTHAILTLETPPHDAPLSHPRLQVVEGLVPGTRVIVAVPVLCLPILKLVIGPGCVQLAQSGHKVRCIFF